MKRPISIQIQDVMGKHWDFDNLQSFKKFLSNEVVFWQKQREGINNPHQFLSQNGYLDNALRTIERWENDIKNWDDNQLQAEISQFKQTFISSNNLKAYWAWSGHPFIHTWIESCKLSNESATAFMEVMQKKTVSQITQSYNHLQGYLLAYEFQLQDEALITKRRNSEKKSIAQLRNRLDNETNALIKEVDEFRDDFNEWHDDIKLDVLRKLKAQKKVYLKSQEIRETEFQTYMNDKKSKIEELENTYHEKLRLEKPAMYWNKKASSYKGQGEMWAKILGAALIIGFMIFGAFFISWTKGVELKLGLNSLQGAVIFATVITIYAILIKAISKMVFSSFHLQRDAEEREQLTHVYLALTNEENNIDVESRRIVLQSLFSRADTGLLGGDSSPTMPGLHELIKVGTK